MFDPLQYLTLMHTEYTGGIAGMAEKVTTIIIRNRICVSRARATKTER